MAGVQVGSSGRLSIEIIAEVARRQQDMDRVRRLVKDASGDSRHERVHSRHCTKPGWDFRCGAGVSGGHLCLVEGRYQRRLGETLRMAEINQRATKIEGELREAMAKVATATGEAKVEAVERAKALREQAAEAIRAARSESALAAGRSFGSA